MDKAHTFTEKAERLEGFRLTKEQYPVAYENKVQELLNEGISTREEAEQMVKTMEFNLELYYEPGQGMFAVECDAVEAGKVYSPYTRAKYRYSDEQESKPTPEQKAEDVQPEPFRDINDVIIDVLKLALEETASVHGLVYKKADIILFSRDCILKNPTYTPTQVFQEYKKSIE